MKYIISYILFVPTLVYMSTPRERSVQPCLERTQRCKSREEFTRYFKGDNIRGRGNEEPNPTKYVKKSS